MEVAQGWPADDRWIGDPGDISKWDKEANPEGNPFSREPGRDEASERLHTELGRVSTIDQRKTKDPECFSSFISAGISQCVRRMVLS